MMDIVNIFLENLGSYLLGICLLIYSLNTGIKRCRYKAVNAVCVSIHTQYFFTSDTVSEGRSGTYKYQFEELIYTVTDKSFLAPRKLKKGKNYILYVNPEDPENFITGFRVGYAKLFCVIGICFLIAPTFLF